MAASDPKEEFTTCFECGMVTESTFMARFLDWAPWPGKKTDQSIFNIGFVKYMCDQCIQPCADCFFPVLKEPNVLFCDKCKMERAYLNVYKPLLRTRQHKKLRIAGESMW